MMLCFSKKAGKLRLIVKRTKNNDNEATMLKIVKSYGIKTEQICIGGL